MQRLVDIGQGRFAHASGALWLPEVSTALVADLHLGYAWAQRRRGELGPRVEGGVLTRIEALLGELAPDLLVVVGDLVHAPRPDEAERAVIERTVLAMRSRTRLLLLPGNHDRGFVRDFPALVEVAEMWCGAGVCAFHGHAVPGSARGAHIVIGHLHPVAGVFDDAGAYQKIPVFVTGSRGTVLPAFSPFSSGARLSQVMTPEVRRLIGTQVRLIAATGRRALEIPRRQSPPQSEQS